ncbi:uncharacterized protein I303_107078 [Kwoniella dejecticola CBS 10117]|uniref:Uncharacterized protein n=1 Tax=Kwoniella dejecticola CBS 10117 TaxID=1296121 RepID=A0AAJ8KV51_9TREE
MPSDPKSSSSRPRQSGSSSKKPSSASDGKHSSGSLDKRSSEHKADDRIHSYLNSHSGFLKPLILSFSSLTSLSPTIISLIPFSIFLVLHLYLPLFILPHLSALITLLIPIQNTISAITSEKARRKSDAAQLLLYWIVYCLLGWLRGGVQIWYPHLKGYFELARSAGLIVVGGPWFGRAGLRPDQVNNLRSSRRESERKSGRSEEKRDEKSKKDKEKDKSTRK